MQLTGECFCGEIKYRVDGALRDARSCHCSRCRKVFSSQASAYAEVEHTQFNWICGQALLSTYLSNQEFGLQFCSRCGSTLVGIYNGNVHGVTLGCINEDPKIEIGRHIFVGSKASWEILPDNIIQFEENVPESQ
ncbi:GFA family protein [Aliikangiella sp. IMCC44359]|uniref:GFA family protein n=1 Tax=Aliikangiella sp. IMCC44359 TaxID=3459125 RepID=UPI00403AFD66